MSQDFVLSLNLLPQCIKLRVVNNTHKMEKYRHKSNTITSKLNQSNKTCQVTKVHKKYFLLIQEMLKDLILTNFPITLNLIVWQKGAESQKRLHEMSYLLWWNLLFNQKWILNINIWLGNFLKEVITFKEIMKINKRPRKENNRL